MAEEQARAALRDFRDAVRAKIERDLAAEERAATERRRRVLDALPQALAQARREGLCNAAWLFGSYAWGSPAERSDVDLMVEGCRDAEHLAAVVGRFTNTEVHVLRVEEAPEQLRARVMAEGLPK